MVLPYGGRVGWRRIVKEGVQKGKIPPCRIGYLISVSNRDTNKSRVPNTFWTPSFFYLIILAKLIFPYIRCIFNEVMEKIG